MILTLTPNPAVDQTMFVSGLRTGEVNRSRESQLSPAGKGINASRMAHRLGWPTIAFGFLAGEIGLIVEKALDDEGVQYHFGHMHGQTRLNVTIVDEVSGTATSIYSPGPSVDQEHLKTLEGLLEFWLPASTVLILAGSLPSGMPEDAYATLIRLAQAQGALTILDSSGEPLRLGVEAKPYLIKPNIAEAESLLGRPLSDLQTVIAGARELAARQAEIVVISMGAQGAVCVQGDRAWQIISPTVKKKSTVGSGDSMIAGIAVALARGEDLVEGLRLGTAAGAATAMTPGTSLGTADDVAELLPRVRIEQL